MVMSLAKTEKAKVMLSRRDGSLGAKERQILIMCNASRQYDEFIQLFGDDVKPILDGLIRQGLVMDAGRTSVHEHGAFSQTGTYYSSEFMSSGAFRSDFKSSQSSVHPGKQATTTASSSNSRAITEAQKDLSTSKMSQVRAESATSGSQTRGRRSLAASKMYIVNLLQMHRDLDSSTLALNIQTSADEQQLITSILASLRYICGKAGMSYGQRVVEQLTNTLPEVYLPELMAFVDEHMVIS